MGVYEILKNAASIFQKAGKIEEYKEILELQSKISGMQTEIDTLKSKNNNLKEKLLDKDKEENRKSMRRPVYKIERPDYR